MAAEHVLSITTESFQREVLERSRTVPVLLDFWAAWCEPCRAFTPILEKIAGEYGGSFILGKVDTEAEQELAYAFQIQSIPFVVLMKNGRPADGFAGAVSEKDLRAFLTRAGIKPKAKAETPAVVDPDSPEARLQCAKAAILQGDAATARQALENFPEDSPLHFDRDQLVEGLEFLDADLTAVHPAAKELAKARQQLGSGAVEPAMTSILGAVALDRSHAGGLGRKAMLLCFALLGEEHPATDAARRQLAALLY